MRKPNHNSGEKNKKEVPRASLRREMNKGQL